jgi:hypothetical protein
MKPLLVKTAHSSGGWKVKVAASKPSPLLSKSASLSLHGKLHAEAFENPILLSLSGKGAILLTILRRKIEVFCY